MNDLQKIMENYGMATENEAVKYVIQQHTALVENLEKTNMALFTAEDELELIDGKLNDLRRGLYWVLSKTGKYHDEEE